MEELGTGFADLAKFILWPYMVIFILFAYLIKKILGDFLQKITKFKWQSVYTVLVIATIVGIPYGIFTEATWVGILVTYTIGTTFHETIFKFIAGKIINR